ncbi:MAG: hypothetical protein LCH54_15695 [Bacteroidetes bacterium]|nr:hypothetical protein [Bacteroidota bacterium]
MNNNTALPKPPIGLKPKRIFLEERLEAICAAILRYQVSELMVPKEWSDEYEEIMRYLGNELPKKENSPNTRRAEFTLIAEFGETGESNHNITVSKDARVSDVLLMIDLFNKSILRQIKSMAIPFRNVNKDDARNFLGTLTFGDLTDLSGNNTQGIKS